MIVISMNQKKVAWKKVGAGKGVTFRRLEPFSTCTFCLDPFCIRVYDRMPYLKYLLKVQPEITRLALIHLTLSLLAFGSRGGAQHPPHPCISSHLVYMKDMLIGNF